MKLLVIQIDLIYQMRRHFYFPSKKYDDIIFLYGILSRPARLSARPEHSTKTEVGQEGSEGIYVKGERGGKCLGRR